MRIIKVRAWDGKKWYEPMYSDGIWYTDEEFSAIAENIVQYTGEKDKHGKDIYEGDVIYEKDGPGGWQKVIEFKNGSWGFNRDGMGNTHPREYREIMGNIHENPELLKQ